MLFHRRGSLWLCLAVRYNIHYLICIFMNINKNVENLGKKQQQKTIAIERFWIGKKIYLVSLKPMLIAQYCFFENLHEKCKLKDFRFIFT